MKNELYLETHTTKEDFEKSFILKVSLESLITYCVYKYCDPYNIKLYFVHTTDSDDKELLSLKADCYCFDFIDVKNVAWQVASCLFPVVLFDDTIITGLCAVSRYICKHRSSASSPYENDGLLGFRKGCLQAPNEVSIWTKFCEVDLIKTVKKLLIEENLKEIPKNLMRFENHLNKPVKLHNMFKVARELKKVSTKHNENSKVAQSVKPSVEVKKISDGTKTPKQRKWKSNKNKQSDVNNSLNIEELGLKHQFAEGPFLTLADLVLVPSYYIIIEKIGKDMFEVLFPLSYQWFLKIRNIKEIVNFDFLLQKINALSLPLMKHLEIPKIEDVSLYKSDPKRHNPKKRLFTKTEDIEKALDSVQDGMELNVSSLEFDKAVDWNKVPDGANPAAGHLPVERVIRKSQQLENLCQVVISMAKEGDLIVDFCSGSGHLGILLAYLLPKCTIILLENKERSLLKAKNRVHNLGLTNVNFFQCNLDFVIGKFDIGIALHACGIASDLVLDKCLKANAKFVLCPCCYGSLHATDRLTYPRSSKFMSMTIDQYLCIGHTADQTHKEHPLTVRGERCMAIIDSDRARLAEEYGYKVTISRLKPLSCTEKNNLLVGVPGNNNRIK
ncbi:glutathione S-transferase C-terminal domain-containing protein homolog [Melitaea cinxia]|uniref:glutathione S-transferase C-terminal domain-containing protein homolog n=1 Tax=Melitaea cinxia TaxID=113334 RepID=UPI001E26F971|nr:glutathione S-transferase C-terminal domain-containing protein homolog [Melitaea cinxia]